MRRHLRGLEAQREQSLSDLGGLALEMYRRDRFDSKLLWKKAAELAAVDDEIRLVQRGLEERRSVAELQEIARATAEVERQARGPERSGGASTAGERHVTAGGFEEFQE
jgi:hypothetical protein